MSDEMANALFSPVTDAEMEDVMAPLMADIANHYAQLAKLPIPRRFTARPATIWTLAFPPLDQFLCLRMDAFTRNAVLLALKLPCAWCSGTGNELLSMYRECPVCGGTGISPVKGLLVARTKSRAPARSMLREFNDFCGRLLRNDINRMFGGDDYE